MPAACPAAAAARQAALPAVGGTTGRQQHEAPVGLLSRMQRGMQVVHRMLVKRASSGGSKHGQLSLAARICSCSARGARLATRNAPALSAHPGALCCHPLALSLPIWVDARWAASAGFSSACRRQAAAVTRCSSADAVRPTSAAPAALLPASPGTPPAGLPSAALPGLWVLAAWLPALPAGVAASPGTSGWHSWRLRYSLICSVQGFLF